MKSFKSPVLFVVVISFVVLHNCKKDKEAPAIPVQFESSTLSLAEGTTGQALRLKLASASGSSKTIKIKITGSATYGVDNDYTLSLTPDTNNELTVVIPPNTTSFTFATIAVRRDGMTESAENISFIFSSLADGIVAGDSKTLDITIVDDPAINFTTGNFSIDEGQKLVPISLAISGLATPTGSVTLSIVSGNNVVLGDGNDLLINPLPSGTTLTLPVTSLTPSFTISSFLDAHPDGNQSVTFTIVSAPAGLSIGVQNTITVSINDNSLGAGIVAEYLFNGGPGDTSGKNHHGTVHGTALTSDRHGVANAAYYFDGSSTIIVPNNADLNFVTLQNFTVSVWASVSDTQNDLGGSINDVMRQWVGDGQGYPFTVTYYNSTHPTDPKKLTAGRYDGSACAHSPVLLSGVVDSEFHHIVFVKKDTQLYLYLDNVLISQDTDTTTCNTSNTSDLVIGCEGGNTRCFTGKIDDIRCYGRALSVNEIGLLYGL